VCMKYLKRENNWALCMNRDHVTSDSTVASGPIIKWNVRLLMDILFCMLAIWNKILGNNRPGIWMVAFSNAELFHFTSCIRRTERNARFPSLGW
jgi:hypothetical protein